MPALQYRVVNATVGQVQREVEVDGQKGIFSVDRLIVELMPVGHGSGLIKLDLPSDTAGYAEDAEFILTLDPVNKEA